MLDAQFFSTLLGRNTCRCEHLMEGADTRLCVGPLCRLGDVEGAEAAFDHARGSGVWSTADATTVNYLLNALSRDSEKAFER